MEETILVHIKGNEKVEEIRSYVEKLASPGMHVTFLVPCPMESWGKWLQDNWITTENRRKAQLDGREINDRFCWETQRTLAEQMLSPCREALTEKGVETSVKLFAGNVKDALKACSADANACLMLALPQNRKPSRRLWWSTEHPAVAMQS